MRTELLVAATTGVGRSDYTKSIEFAVQAAAKGHQKRAATTGSFAGIPTVAWPDFYTLQMPFWNPQTGVYQYPAPAQAHFIFSCLVTVHRATDLVILGFYRFDSYSDWLIFNYDAWYGTMLGYGSAELKYTHGVRTVEGKYYASGLCAYSANPTFDLDFQSHGISEEVVYG